MQQLIRTAWPAFLMACLLEMVVFAVIDPLDVRWLGQIVSETGVYSLSFFVFWAICFGGNALMMFLNCSTCPAAKK